VAVQLVTGVAGFIGSHLAERLLKMGHRVRGIDCLTPYYSRQMKESNLSTLTSFNNFEFLEVDLRSGDLAPCLGDVSVVFHQAAQPGVRRSWADGFSEYVSCNIQATQRLLEAARVATLQRFVYASSSSVYGNAVSYPSMETDLLRPFSPYGVTKLAGEHLCMAYAANYGVPTVSLRYFTVYGPHQRPDMAIFRLIQAALGETTFPLYGDGNHTREFTFITGTSDFTGVRWWRGATS